MRQKEKMSSWQMILGILLSVGLIAIALAFPRVGIVSSRIADMMMDKVTEAFQSTQGGEKLSGAQVEELQDAIQDEEKMAMVKEQVVKSLDQRINGWKQKQVPTQMTNWQIVANSYQDLYNLAAGEYGDTYDDVISKGDASDASSVAKDKAAKVKRLARGYNLFRLLVGFMTFLPILVLAFVLLNFFQFVSKMPALITTWIYAVFNVIYLVVWYLVLPQVLGSSIKEIGDSVFGFSAIFAINDNAFASAVLSTMNMEGFLFWNILTVLLVAWSGFCIIFQSSRYSYNDAKTVRFNRSDFKNASKFVEGSTEIVQKDETEHLEEGSIHGVRGTLDGQIIQIRDGEKLVVGRDPEQCQIVLQHPKMSMKHCLIQYDQAKEEYQIFCYAISGLQLSDGRILGEHQAARVKRGITVLLADGHEALLLY